MGERERKQAAQPSREELRSLLESLVAERRTDDVVALFFETIERISEAHARTLFELKQALKQRYGSRSEKLQEGQLDLLAEMIWDVGRNTRDEVEVSQPVLEVDESQPRDLDAPRRPARGRRPLPETLPRETVVIPVPETERTCPGCGEDREVIGHESSEVLEYTPAVFTVRRVAREKRACRRCKQGVAVAPAAPKVHERGIYGPGLIAQIVVSKFKDHLPLYRQRQIYKRGGVDLPRSTLGDAVAGAASLWSPVAERIRETILADDVVQTDDTGLRVLDRDHPKRIKRGVLWPYRADRLAYFQYTPTRAAAGPQELLAGYRGVSGQTATSFFGGGTWVRSSPS